MNVALFVILFIVTVVVYTVNGQRAKTEDIVERLTIPDGAICKRRVPAYMVVENFHIESKTSTLFKNVSEKTCAAMCSDNKDDHDKSILCSSFTFDKRHKSCFIHRQKAKPVGELTLIPDEGFRYYEKFCLPPIAPLDCSEAFFFRLDNVVLEGSASDSKRARKLEDCMDECIKQAEDCKSAMFFPDAEECILNTKSALQESKGFIEEPNDNVLYFENGCILEDQIRKQEAKKGKTKTTTSETEEPSTTTKTPSDTTKPKPLLTTTKSTKKLNASADEDSEFEEVEVVEYVDDEATEPPKGSVQFGEWSEWSECDRPDGRRTRKRNCKASPQDCKGKLLESQWCQDVFTSTTTTTQGTTTSEQQSTTEQIDVSPKFFLAQQRSSQAPIVAEESSGPWGPWSRDCRPFGQNQPCVDNSIVGFQNRQCLRSPSECRGPFSRYCFIPCQLNFTS